MNGLVHVVMFFCVLMAFIAWAVALMTALSVIRLAPRGQKIASYFQLGWFRFAALEQRLGPQVQPLIRRYRRAFIVFFGVLLVLLLIVFGTIAMT
ncbi:MAG: hypothetical protein AB7F76_13750 [Parvibaculaceae bacterium]|jgi:hypothetical protein